MAFKLFFGHWWLMWHDSDFDVWCLFKKLDSCRNSVTITFWVMILLWQSSRNKFFFFNYLVLSFWFLTNKKMYFLLMCTNTGCPSLSFHYWAEHFKCHLEEHYIELFAKKCLSCWDSIQEFNSALHWDTGKINRLWDENGNLNDRSKRVE